MHRGPLSKLREEYENEKASAIAEKPSEVKPKVTAAITKGDYHPVKDIIKDIEKDNTKIKDNKPSGDEGELIDKTVDNKSSESTKTEEVEKVNITAVVPPKPLPRTSRTGSMCDTSVEDATNVPKPVARPRTNSCAPVVTSVNPNVPIAGGYKVILVSM